MPESVQSRNEERAEGRAENEKKTKEDRERTTRSQPPGSTCTNGDKVNSQANSYTRCRLYKKGQRRVYSRCGRPSALEGLETLGAAEKQARALRIGAGSAVRGRVGAR